MKNLATIKHKPYADWFCGDNLRSFKSKSEIVLDTFDFRMLYNN